MPPCAADEKIGANTSVTHAHSLTDIKALTMFMRDGGTSGKAGSFSSHMDLTSSIQNTPLQSSILIGLLRAQCHTTGIMTNFNRLPVCCGALGQRTKCPLFFETSEINKGTAKQSWITVCLENVKTFKTSKIFNSKANAVYFVVPISQCLWLTVAFYNIFNVIQQKAAHVQCISCDHTSQTGMLAVLG